jgi:hypothetical protein
MVITWPSAVAFCRTAILRAAGPAHDLRGPEYPGFIAVGNDAVEFGLSHRPGADPVASALTWQLGISDVDAAVTACERAGLRFEVTVERPREDWTYRIIEGQSPSGMEVLLEEQTPPSRGPGRYTANASSDASHFSAASSGRMAES